VRVVLGETAHPGETREGAALLIAVDGAELGEAQRQLAIAAGAGAEDEVVERAVHGLQVVVLALLDHVALVVDHLVEVHGREHAVLVPVEVLAGLEEGALGDVRAVDDVVAVLQQLAAHERLDLVPDDAALGVEHREARSDLVGEAEQVELDAQFAVVALRRLLEPGLIGAQLVLGGPRSPVDALQHRVLLAAAPVRAGAAHERPAVADHAGVRQVRASAEVLPAELSGLRIDVVVDGEFGAADLDAFVVGSRLRAALQPDQLELVGFVGQLGTGVLLGDDATDEALPLLHDLLHLGRDRLQVLRSEGLGRIEVVVEAVGDGRPDAELRLGVDALHRLREHVGGRVPQDVEPILGIDRDGLHRVGVRHLRREVAQLAVDAHRDDRTIGEQGEAIGHG
jgi:hypothetical protein